MDHGVDLTTYSTIINDYLTGKYDYLIDKDTSKAKGTYKDIEYYKNLDYSAYPKMFELSDILISISPNWFICPDTRFCLINLQSAITVLFVLYNKNIKEPILLDIYKMTVRCMKNLLKLEHLKKHKDWNCDCSTLVEKNKEDWLIIFDIMLKDKVGEEYLATCI